MWPVMTDGSSRSFLPRTTCWRSFSCPRAVVARIDAPRMASSACPAALSSATLGERAGSNLIGKYPPVMRTTVPSGVVTSKGMASTRSATVPLMRCILALMSDQ